MSSASKILRVGLITPVQSIDPRGNTDFINMLVPGQIYESPYLSTSAGGTPEPVLFAELLKSETIGDQQVLSASIRPGVKFSDGTPMTINHVVSSLLRNKDILKQAGISKRKDRVVFTMKRPISSFELSLTAISRSIVLEKGYQICGTGPFMLAPDATLGNMRLLRNPHYRKPVAIDEIHFKVYPRDKNGRANALRQALVDKEIDFTSFLQRDEINDLTSVRKCVEPGKSIAILFFNTQRYFFNDVRMRKALAMAIDRQAIAKLFYPNPLAYTASGILPPAMDRIRDGIQYGLKDAIDLLRDSGLKPPDHPLSLAIIWGPRPYLPRPMEAAELIAKQLGKLGIKVNCIQTRNLDDFYSRTSNGNYDMFLSGWLPDTPDPSDTLDSLLFSEYIPDAELSALSRNNLSRWQSPAMDRALVDYRQQRSESSKNTIGQLLGEEVPLLPLMYGSTVTVHSWHLMNCPASFGAFPYFGPIGFKSL